MKSPKLLAIATLAACIAISMIPAAAEKHECKTIQFFLHDNLVFGNETISGNQSAFFISPPLPEGFDQSSFGAVVVFDDSATLDPSETSTEIGRGRGTYTAVANDDKGPEFKLSWTAEFNGAGGYGAGSTLVFEGFDRLLNPTREIAITGGTGDYRFASGYAEITTFSLVGAAAVLNITGEVCYRSWRC